MKKRLFAYFVLLPVILLGTFVDITSYLRYLAIASIPLSIGLIIYMFIKTKAFYKMKKCLMFLLFFLSLFSIVPKEAIAQDPMMMYDGYSYQMYVIQMEQERQEAAEKMRKAKEIISELRKKRSEGKELTKKEEEKLKQAIEDYKEAQKKFTPPCPTPKELHAELVSDCWACQVANLFIEASDKVASGFYKLDKEQGFSKSLLALGFFFWILTHVIKLIMSFGSADIGAFFTGLFIKILTVGGIFILLTYPQAAVNFFISPFFLFSSVVTGELSKVVNEDMSKVVEKNDRIDVLFNEQGAKELDCTYCTNLDAPPDSRITTIIKYNGIRPEDRVVSPLMRNSLLCTICTIYNITVQPTVTGQFLTCKAKEDTVYSTPAEKQVYKSWDAIVVGFGLTVTFFLISALFSFYLLDSFFRICFVLILMPFLLVAAAFTSTLIYAKKGFEVIIHATATYIIIGLFMNLTVQMFYLIIGDHAKEMVKLTYANDYPGLVELIGFNGGNGGQILLACGAVTAIIFFMFGQLDSYVAELTNIQLGNGGGLKAAQQVAGTAAAMAKTVSDVYSASWKRPGNNTGNSPEDKAKKIREWGEDDSDGAAEKATDKLADNIDQKGTEAAKNMAESGKSDVTTGASDIGSGFAQCCTGVGIATGLAQMAAGVGKMAMGTGKMAAAAALWVATKITSTAVKHGSRLVIKTAKRLNPAKIIARNKYFNKTVGLFWQAGSDMRDAYKDGRQRYRNAKAWAKRKYRHRRKRP